MGRPRKTVDEIDLFRFHRAHMGDFSRQYPIRDDEAHHSNDVERRATVWFMHQFDAVIMWQAFTGVEASRARTHHRPESWDLYRIIRKYIELLDDETVTDKGPKVSTSTKVACLEKLREFMRVGASLHREFLVSIGKAGPDDSVKEPESVRDPIVLQLTSDAS